MIIAAAQTLEFVLIGAVVLGAAFSLMFPALALLVVSRAPKERRGLAVGTFTAFFDVAVGIGTPIAGGIAALSGYPAAFLLDVADGFRKAYRAASTPRLDPDRPRSRASEKNPTGECPKASGPSTGRRTQLGAERARTS